MAVSTTFKQQCPSCEAMITVKETLIGKKVECTKCKDKFIAKKPVDEDIDEVEAEEEPAKKNTKVSTKKSTSTTAAKPPGKRPKLEVDDEEDEEAPKGKNGKANTNGMAKAASKKAEDEDDDDDEDDEAAAKKKKKLTIGLALAGVGVVILVIAAFTVLSGSRQQNKANNPGPANPGPIVQDPKDKKGPTPVIDNTPVDVVAVALSDAERVKLSNLLPNDTEHVFHAYFKELFDTTSSLRAAVFDTKGALNDEALKRQLGFSLLAIDDLICAERVTVPWRYTVIHFKDLINEKDLKTALKLKAVGKGIDGQVYYKMEDVHPWFNQLARFSFGVPNNLRSLDPPNNRPTYVRIHNAQTLIVA
ncbi:MAG TPA: hypothetical protein VFE62_26505, partial [Gemmataceae bacterium]|nr:hypothetical protein [Gemmataceae bacterium]